MKKKVVSKKAPIKLDLEKIEIDALSDSTMDGLQGGYQTEYVCTVTVFATCCYSMCPDCKTEWACW